MSHILVVDDSLTQVIALKNFLENNGFRISIAMSGEEGIDLAKQEKPDLIIMDVYMPGISGFQATRFLSTDPDTRTIPILIVTHRDSEHDISWGLRQGARNYLIKPVSEQELLSQIGALLNRPLPLGAAGSTLSEALTPNAQ